jgi:hypothetical protein
VAGRIHALIKELMALRAKGGGAGHFIRAHLALSGVDPDLYHDESPDEEAKIALLEKMIHDYREKAGRK